MDISIHDARSLVSAVLQKRGLCVEHACIVTDHLLYAAMNGLDYAGLPRALTIADQLKHKGPGGTISVVSETPTSAVFDGGDVVGYVPSLKAIDKAIELSRRSGFSIVGVRNSWFNGSLSYYVQRAAEVDLIAFHVSSAPAMVAPFGGMDKIFGTNPIAFSFPSDEGPVTIDISTSSLTWADVILRHNTNRELPANCAVDSAGMPTTDAGAALNGALLAFGGHRGSALSFAVQIFGILAGGRTVSNEVGDSGFFFLVFDPSLLMPISEFKAKVSELVRLVESSRPIPGINRVRIPGTGSKARRAQAQRAGRITVDAAIYRALTAIAAE